MFSQKTRAPARNADPRRIACVSHLSSRRHGRGKKLCTLLGSNSDQGVQKCCGADFGSRVEISGHPMGQSASFFEIYPFRLVQGERGGVRNENLSMVPQMSAFAEGTKYTWPNGHTFGPNCNQIAAKLNQSRGAKGPYIEGLIASMLKP